MKTYLLFLFICSTSLAMPVGNVLVTPENTKIQFSVVNLLITTAHGSFEKFKGEIKFSKNFLDSKFAATIQTGSINTNEDKRDEHLRSVDYFNVEKFPEMTFESKSLEGAPEKFKMKGTMNLLGQSREVTLDCQWNQDANQIVANAVVNRKDFGMTSGPTIKDNVSITIIFKL